jgi:hypothetical protein
MVDPSEKVLNRMVLMTIVEILLEVCARRGHNDLAERCDECRREIVSMDDVKKEEG